MTITNNTISFDFSPTTGALNQLRFIDGETVLGHGVGGHALDLLIGKRGWISEVEAPALANHSTKENGITLELTVGPVALYDEYHVEGSLITRRVRVENRSEEQIQVKALRLTLLGARLGSRDDCLLEVPASILRPRLPLEKIVSLGERVSTHESLTPGAIGWLDYVGSAPDVTPGLLALHNPTLEESLLIWYYSEVEGAAPRVVGGDQALDLGHDLNLASWLTPGSSLTGGTQYVQLVRGSWSEALKTYQQTYARVGLEPTMYRSPPDWVDQASIYEVHPGQFGGFRGLTEQLPRIRSIGFDVLYLMPVMRYDNRNAALWDENWIGSGSPYAIKDFEEFEPTLGTEADFRYLVEQAHQEDMRVLMDFVSQGSALDARYVEEHPEWYCRDEKGDLVSSHGWNDTYSLDWANPEYQAFMLNWALRLVQEYEIDGYRVDAPHGKEPNWDQAIPYHASYTSLGSLRMLEQLQRSLKAMDPENALLCESFGPVFVKSHDFQYDYHPHGMLNALFMGKLTPYEFGEYMRDYWTVMPPSARRVCFTETHDTRVGFPSYAMRGSMGERAMFAILILAGFIPMLWSGQEEGFEDFYSRVLRARKESPALRHGRREFNVIPCDNPLVLSILCDHPDELLWGVVSLCPERTPLTFDLEGVYKMAGDPAFGLHDRLSGTDWNEYGRDRWSHEEASALTLSFVPFMPYYFRLTER